MAKVLVLYYSMYGHIETMARAVAEGASKVDGAEVVVKRVPETMPPQLFEKAGGKTQTAPVATRKNWPITTPLFLVHLPALVTCPVKCVPSSTRRAACGLPAHYTENWRASLVPRYWRRSGTNHHIHLDDPCASRHGDCPHWLRSAGII